MKLHALRKRTAVLLEMVCILTLALTAFLIWNRNSFVADVAGAFFAGTEEAFEVALKHAEAGEDLYIPFPPDVHYEDVRFENRYSGQELHVLFRTRDTAFFRDNALICNPEKVRAATSVQPADGGIRLVLYLDALYESDFVFEDDGVRLTLARPQEKYDRIIVVDPALNGTGRDVALLLSEKLRDICAASGNGTKLYITRTDGRVPDNSTVLDLVASSGAVRYLRIAALPGDDGLSASVAFYDGFYIRGYGNDSFAKDVARGMNVVEGLQLGEVAAYDAEAAGEVLSGMKIPAAVLRIDGLRRADGEDEETLEEIALALWAGMHAGF